MAQGKSLQPGMKYKVVICNKRKSPQIRTMLQQVHIETRDDPLKYPQSDSDGEESTVESYVWVVSANVL